MEKTSYTIRSTGSSSEKLGLCEICNQYASDVHIQRTRFHVFEDKPEQFACGGYSFGHRDCLESKRTPC